MITESIIRDKVILELKKLTALPVFQFGDREEGTEGAQFVVQCDRPNVAFRDRVGRRVENEYNLIIHVIIHSQKHREDGTLKGTMLAVADEFIDSLDNDTVDAWLNGAGACTGLHEQDGDYQFNETFDDFTTAVDMYIMPTQES